MHDIRYMEGILPSNSFVVPRQRSKTPSKPPLQVHSLSPTQCAIHNVQRSTQNMCARPNSEPKRLRWCVEVSHLLFMMMEPLAEGTSQHVLAFLTPYTRNRPRLVRPQAFDDLTHLSQNDTPGAWFRTDDCFAQRQSHRLRNG